MVTTFKVGKIEITSDQTKTTQEFLSLVDSLTQRVAPLIPNAVQLETGQATATTPAATTTPATTSVAAVQTVSTV